MNKLPILLILSLIVARGLVAQSVPLLISYQGVLTDDTGNPLAQTEPTNYQLEFRVLDALQAGNILWSEAQTVTVFEGGFSALLGTGDEIDAEPRPPLDAVFNGPERFLEISLLDGGTPKTFSPRQQMASTPFALRAKTADQALTVASGVVNTPQLANASITKDKLVSDSVDASKIAANAVGADEIQAAAVGMSELANSSISIEKLADALAKRLVPAGSVTAWAGYVNERTLGGVQITGIPEGWLKCQGQAEAIADYPELFSVIGHTYSQQGDDLSGTTFRVPDYRGQFLRGLAGGTAQDPGFAERIKRPWAGDSWVGSTQPDEFKEHNHNPTAQHVTLMRQNAPNTHSGIGGTNPYTDRVAGYDHSGHIQARGGVETRPKNTAVHYIIKAH